MTGGNLESGILEIHLPKRNKNIPYKGGLSYKIWQSRSTRRDYYFSGAKGGFLAGEGERREDFFLRSREIHTKRGATLTHQRQIFLLIQVSF